MEVMSGPWLAAACRQLAHPSLAAFVQGYSYTGFAKLQEGALVFPRQLNVPHDVNLLWDVRVFSAAGEWHGWKNNGIWRDRRYPLAGDERLPIPRTYPLWGRQIDYPEEGWTRFREVRGSEVWVPGTYGKELQLKTIALIDFHGDSHLAGIVDSVFCGWEEIA